MPPKRVAKRKAVASESSGDEAESSKAPKKSKTSQDELTDIAPNGQPTNKVLPTRISFPPRTPGILRLAAWNVCGLAASQKKGFKYYIEAEDPDILVLTETKVNNMPVDLALRERFPHACWCISDKKGYSGTAILSKHKPISISKELPGHPDPSIVNGRIATMEFVNCYVVGTYVPNAGQNLKTMDVKKEWNRHFEQYIRDLDAKKPVIWTGDLNVAPTEIDLSNAKKNWNKTAGYTEPETTSFRNILNSPPPPEFSSNTSSSSGTNDPPAAGPSTSSGTTSSSTNPGFIDVWRKLHPEDQHYTYFSYRFNCRSKGIGWRLDMFVLSARLVDRVKMCEIRSEIYGASDHCPIVLEIEGAL
ncbi:hypothetical protein PLICRDRAFT_175973 [Plicaturopsis crispa FD-325 SS-3]|nr:hypothetical protein PLICRDRAFT_175973 [Plicaturopsis crispa FD-325 SS-3]